MDLEGGLDVFADRISERREQRTAASHHPRERRAVEIDPVPSVDLALPVKGLMITVLGGQDVREESCTCDAAFDRTARCWCLQDLRAARAGELRSNVSNDLELLGHTLEDLTHIFAQIPEFAAATWAGTLGRHLGM